MTAATSESRSDRAKAGRPAEAPLVLDLNPATPLGLRDQTAFWANLGVSLLGFSGALAVIAPAGFPRLSLPAALVATVVGTVVGAGMVAVAGVPGVRTGAPAMALLRGLFGTRLSYLPTVLNIIQCLGWGMFELLVIAQGAQAITGGRGPHWAYVVGAGLLTTGLTLRPLGALRLLRRYVTVAVLLSLAYLTVMLLRQGMPAAGGGWRGFFPGVDAALAVAVSWVPLAADYTRHSRGVAPAVNGTMLGYTLTQVWCYALGLIALGRVGDNPDQIFSAMLAAPAGAVFFGVLVLREVDQSFANVYSTAMSTQNLRPLVDRRLLCVLIGALTTGCALTFDLSRYQNFLYLIGSVFVPLFAVLAVDYLVGRGRTGWDLSERAKARPLMLAPWAVGFAVYQLLNPGGIGWWAGLWRAAGRATGVRPQVWTSASLGSFLVAAVVTGVVVTAERLTHRPPVASVNQTVLPAGVTAQPHRPSETTATNASPRPCSDSSQESTAESGSSSPAPSASSSEDEAGSSAR